MTKDASTYCNQGSEEDNKKIIIVDLTKKLDDVSLTKSLQEQKIRQLEQSLKDLSAKNAVLNKELRDARDANERYYTKTVIFEGELSIANNKLKQAEISLQAIREELGEADRKADYFRLRQAKERENNQKIMANVKRLTMKLRKAQMLVLESKGSS